MKNVTVRKRFNNNILKSGCDGIVVFLSFTEFSVLSLRKKCPNTGLFLVRISCIRIEYEDLRDKSPYSIDPNTGKYGPEITPYLDTFHAECICRISINRYIV